MNIQFKKQEMLDELLRLKGDYEPDGRSYHIYDEDDGEDASSMSKEEHEERVQEAIDFVSNLTEDDLQNAVKGMTLKKNGKPRKGSIATLFVGDTGYWFVEWYVTYSTFRIVARAIDENTMEVVLGDININAGDYPVVTRLK